MPFIRDFKVDYVSGEFDLRNEWMLEVGEATRTGFTYEQFVRNCRELKHFGYRYEGARGYMPQYYVYKLEDWKEEGDVVTVSPKLAGIRLTDERFGDPGPLRTTPCCELELDFVRPESGGKVVLRIESESGIEGEMLLLRRPFSACRRTRFSGTYKTRITYHFEEVVFRKVLVEYGLLGEEEKNA